MVTAVWAYCWVFLPNALVNTLFSKGPHNHHVILISGSQNPSPRKPLNFPGILDPAFKGEVKILLLNLTDSPIKTTSGQTISYFPLNPIKSLIKAKKCGDLKDLGLVENYKETIATITTLTDNLNEEEKKYATTLLEEYANLFLLDLKSLI